MGPEARSRAGAARLGVSVGAANTVAVLRRPGERAQPLLFDGSALLPSEVQARPDGSLATGQEAVGLARDGRQPPIGPEYAFTAIFLRIADEVRALVGYASVETVVACPPESTPDERSRIVRAAAAAGFGQVELLDEPIAAGAYLVRTMKYDVPVGCSLVVVDVGAVRADVSLLRMTGSGFEPAASERIPDAGGSALESALIGLVRTWVTALGGTVDWPALTAPRTPDEEQLASRFRWEVRAAKEILSTQASVVVRMPSGPPVTIPRPQFETVAAGVLAPIVEAVRRMLDTTKAAGGEAVVLLIGGTSRMPILARQLVAKIAYLPATLAVDEPELVLAYGCVAQAPTLLDEDVQFTVYRPARLLPSQWESLLVFAHKSDPVVDPVSGPLDPLVEVERRARQHFAPETARSQSVDSRQPVARGTDLRVVPELVGAQCNPPAAELQWQEAVHEVQFRIRPTLPAGEVVRGFVRIWCGPLVIGEVSVAMPVGAGVVGGPMELAAQPMTRYRKIFPSYSSRDREIVDQFVAAARALGDQYLQDVLTLRTGEDWDQRLIDLIAEADVFQLFWSSNSMVSPNCRREWERALDLGRQSFVRPVYWEDPLPRAPHLDLPPQQLRALHFAKVPVLFAAAAPGAVAVGRASMADLGRTPEAGSAPHWEVDSEWRRAPDYGGASGGPPNGWASLDSTGDASDPTRHRRRDEPPRGREAGPPGGVAAVPHDPRQIPAAPAGPGTPRPRAQPAQQPSAGPPFAAGRDQVEDWWSQTYFGAGGGGRRRLSLLRVAGLAFSLAALAAILVLLLTGPLTGTAIVLAVAGLAGAGVVAAVVAVRQRRRGP